MEKGIKVLGIFFLSISLILIIGFGISNQSDYGILFGWLIPTVVLSPLVAASLGFLRYKNWARVLFLWIAWITGIILLFWTYIIWTYNPSRVNIHEIFGNLFFSFLPISFAGIIYFLTRPKVKELFRGERSDGILPKDNTSQSRIIFGWALTVIGILGSSFLVLLILGWLSLLLFSEGETRVMGSMGIFAAPFFLPFPLLLIAGIRILKKRISR